ncbi:hypothetical protein GpartN1_g4057.t1 [Galdieria partita]|uniref:Carbamoyltransferase n=1 Tax=Galdieria partita TaxID=83374 RepID=A0A9C7UQZ6_9RHOD|nr:hypothetical protein GpartN1_g4057.t1 [Galdieria partita]
MRNAVGFLPCGANFIEVKQRKTLCCNPYKRQVCFRLQLYNLYCKYIVGINKYSHDASVCLLSCDTGEIVGNFAKERFTRRKHDGNDVGELVEHIFARLGIAIEDVDLVVQNNHHYSIGAFEEKLPWTSQMNYYPRQYLSPYNLFLGIPKVEISHHLAHAWSVYAQLEAAVASNGDSLILVMDGMGDSSRELISHSVNSNAGMNRYIHDLLDCTSIDPGDWKQQWSDKCYPKDIELFENLREAESCYRCSKSGIDLVWKRWSRERSPTEWYNYSFEDMESIGAVYSRIASHIFGDWNSCGKVMGLAAYHIPTKRHTSSRMKEWIRRLENENILSGHLPERLDIHWDLLKQLPYPNQWNERDEDLFHFYAALAHRIQKDTETVVVSLIRRLSKQHSIPILGLCGGLFLNSSLNGKILSESCFDHVWIPPYPGDEGIAIGCALYGYHYMKHGRFDVSSYTRTSQTAARRFSPFLGLDYSKSDIEEAVQEYLPWIEEVKPSKIAKDRLKPITAFIAEELYKNHIVAVFRGRAESGPRALGNRSILANPCDPNMKDRLNRRVKFRESFRPFAPTVLEENVTDILEFSIPVETISESCRYMSVTVSVKEEMISKIPAVVHVDKTARVQVLRRTEICWFYDVISEFYQLSKIPAVLNTSFNIRGEPIVESPYDAFDSFLDPSTEIDWLILEDRIFRKKTFPKAYHLMKVVLRRPIQIHTVENPLMDEVNFEVVDLNGKIYQLVSDIDTSILQLASTNKYTCDEIIQELREEVEDTVKVKFVLERIEFLWKLRLISLLET